VKDIIAKSLGSSNGINVAHATIEGLKQLRRPEEIAASRDKPADHVIPSGRCARTANVSAKVTVQVTEG